MTNLNGIEPLKLPEIPDGDDFDTIYLLPGGYKHYVEMIMAIVAYIISLVAPTIRDVETVITRDNDIQQGTLQNCVQLLQRMGLFVRQPDTSVTVKPLARLLVQTASLEQQTLIIAEVMWQHCLAMADVLALFSQAGPLTTKDIVRALKPRFPQWEGPWSFKQRLRWWQDLGCLTKHNAHSYTLTEVGKSFLLAHGNELDALLVAPMDDDGPDDTDVVDIVEDLIDELQAASLDGNHSHRLERALVDVLAFVKEWIVYPKARPGQSEEDSLATSLVPSLPLTLIFDAKARSAGKLTQLNVLNLVEYRAQAGADGAVAVSADFADGKTVRQAAEQGVTLLTVDVLSALLRLLASTPLALEEFQDIFLKAGLVETLPDTVEQAAKQQKLWAELIARIFYTLEESHANGWNKPFTTEQIEAMLFTRLKDRRYEPTPVPDAINILCSPILGALQRDKQGAVMLRMTHATFIRRLRALTDRIEAVLEALTRGDAASANTASDAQ